MYEIKARGKPGNEATCIHGCAALALRNYLRQGSISTETPAQSKEMALDLIICDRKERSAKHWHAAS